jgi:hypothetical protein
MRGRRIPYGGYPFFRRPGSGAAVILLRCSFWNLPTRFSCAFFSHALGRTGMAV